MVLVDIIGIKPAHGDHKSNFRKVDAIPSGCNTKREIDNIFASSSYFNKWRTKLDAIRVTVILLTNPCHNKRFGHTKLDR